MIRIKRGTSIEGVTLKDGQPIARYCRIIILQVYI